MDQESKIFRKWGGSVTDGETGFTAVPDILIRSQSRLRLSPTEMVVLLNLLLHWWEEERGWPYPRVTTIAQRMGVNRRSVERAIRSLESKGFVLRLESESRNGLTVRRFDLSGLVEELRMLADERRTSQEVDAA